VSRSRALLSLAVAAGIAVLMFSSRREERFREVSDGAILEISTIEALHGRQLVGPYSRFGWNHPGPLYFFFESPWYLASGRHTAGMIAGAIALNVSSLAIVAALCFRWLRPIPAAFIAGAMAVYLLRVPDLIASVWNPHVIIVPMIAVVLLLAAFGDTGRPLFFFGALVGGSFIVQTHVAMVPIVAVLGACAAAMQPRVVRAIAWQSIGLSWALWVAPLWEQLTRTPGNLTRLSVFFTRETLAGQGAGNAVNAWAAELGRLFGPPAPLAMGADLHPDLSAARLTCVAIELSILAILSVEAWKREHRSTACVSAAALIASLVALGATLRISGQLVDHEVFWISIVGALNAGAIAGAVADMFAHRFDALMPAPRALRTAGIISMILVSVTLGAAGMRNDLNRRRTLEDHAVDAIVEDVRGLLSERAVSRPLFRIDSGIAPTAFGALLQLYKMRQPFAVEDAWVHVLGESFRGTGREDVVIAVEGSLAAPRVGVSRD
jgi:hypothetical protein